MATPPSITKINKDGVSFVSSVDRCEYTIKELSRAALKDVGKYIRKGFREEFYKEFEKRTGKGPKAVKYTVFSSANTIKPRVEIGLPKSAPGKPVTGFYSFFQEVGTSKQKKLGLLSKFVENHVATIIQIESQYISALEDEAKALALIDEREEESDEDD